MDKQVEAKSGKPDLYFMQRSLGFVQEMFQTSSCGSNMNRFAFDKNGWKSVKDEFTQSMCLLISKLSHSEMMLTWMKILT